MKKAAAIRERRVYIPFEDGSSVSFDGARFSVHKCPVGIEADLNALVENRAEQVWRERRGDVVRALQAAWWRLEEERRRSETKKIYSGPKGEGGV